MKSVQLALVALLIGACSAYAQSPSFSCSGRLNPTEEAICDSRSLSQLDRELSEIFQRTLDRLDDRQRNRLTAAQRDWLRERDSCASDVACIRNSYRDRTTALMVDADRPAPTEPPRQRSAEACAQIFDRVCIDVPAGSDFALRCHRRYPEILNRIPDRCHADFQTLVENAREALEQERAAPRRAAPGIPTPNSDWFETSENGWTRYRVENGSRNSFTINCSQGRERMAGERAYIDVIINGYSSNQNSEVTIIVDGQVFKVWSNGAGDLPTNGPDTATTFRDLWSALRYANSITVRHSSGTARFSAKGSRDTLPEQHCQTTWQ